MKSHGLARFIAPPPPPAPRCMAPQCEMAPEVIVPLGEGALELCWLCAHHHVDHGVPLSEVATSERCEHTPDEIYPRAKIMQSQSESGREIAVHAECTARLTVARVITSPGEKPVLMPAKPAWCRGRGPDRVSRMRRSK